MHVRRSHSLWCRGILVYGLLGLMLGCTAAPPTLLKDVQSHSTEDNTQVVITTSSPVQPQVGKLSNPERIFIDLPGTRVASGWGGRQITVNDGRVQQIRVAQYQPDVARIVVHLQNFRTYRVTSQGSPARILADFTGPGASGSTVEQRPSTQGPMVIVLDPGHGGKDPGAIGPGGLAEKTVVLQVAKELRSVIQREMPEVRVVLTRDQDIFIPLTERARIANAHQARLFVSLHLNSSRSAEASGIETWYLSFAASDRAKKAAARENMMSESQLPELEIIMRDLYETDRINQSALLAKMVQNALVSKMGQQYADIADRGIEGAPFAVLVHTKMPSVLGELSFVSNPRDEARLRLPDYQRSLALGVFQGIRRFLQPPVAALEHNAER